MADVEKINDGVNVSLNDTISDTITYSKEHIRKVNILRNVYIKLDGLPLSFGLPIYKDEIPDSDIIRYFRTDYADTFREVKIGSLNDIEENSSDEMHFENRILYYALKRFRLTSSVYFKFSTATDGKTVDKTNVPKMLSAIIAEYDNEYKKWRTGNVGRLWNRGAS